MNARDRFLGCMLGGAVGDALGAPVEFMSRAKILRSFGPEGVTDYHPIYGGVGRITDDTQMALFSAEGLLRGWMRWSERGTGPSFVEVTAHAYHRWLLTQGEKSDHEWHAFGDLDPRGWLFRQEALHSRRAPGNTCLAALKGMQGPGLAEPAKNDSKGCGGVMRVAPAGLFVARLGQNASLGYAFELGVDLAALTHGHPTGSLSAGVLSALIYSLSFGEALEESLNQALGCLTARPNHKETLHALTDARELAVSHGDRHAAIARLGQGWVAEEALAIAVYCALVADDFRDGVVLAVNHDGDSDSTGAITGNILGTLMGAQAIPQSWLEQLELREVITEIAEDLYRFPDWDVGPYGKDQANIREKYPPF